MIRWILIISCRIVEILMQTWLILIFNHLLESIVSMKTMILFHESLMWWFGPMKLIDPPAGLCSLICSACFEFTPETTSEDFSGSRVTCIKGTWCIHGNTILLTLNLMRTLNSGYTFHCCSLGWLYCYFVPLNTTQETTKSFSTKIVKIVAHI